MIEERQFGLGRPLSSCDRLGRDLPRAYLQANAWSVVGSHVGNRKGKIAIWAATSDDHHLKHGLPPSMSPPGFGDLVDVLQMCVEDLLSVVLVGSRQESVGLF